MHKFFSKFLKHKKTLFFLFLFLVVIFSFLPQITLASWFTDAKTTFGNAVLNGLITAVFISPVVVSIILSTISKTIFGLAMTFALSQSYTGSDAVKLGWPIVRDLANMIIVLGFVVVGIATSLRIESYGAKKLLPKLIIVALLINFSLLFCGIFIDASNILMKYFFMGKGGLENWAPGVKQLANLYSDFADKGPMVFAPALMSIMFFNLILSLVCLLYAVLLLSRTVAIWMLVILSPLAFVCAVFPGTKSIWDTWKKNFTQWCIIVIPVGLFYYIGLQMISKLTNPTSDIDAISKDWEKFFNASFSTVLVPGLFLIVGFLVSLKFAPMGAGAIMNFANKYKGKALSGGLGVLAKGSGAIGAGAAWVGKHGGWVGRNIDRAIGKPARFFGNAPARIQRIKSAVTRAGEWAGAVKPGTAGALEGKELKENQARMSALIAQGRLAEVNAIAEGKGTGSNPMERAAAIGALLKSKNFDFDNEDHKAGISYFRKHGGDIGEYSDKDPRYAEYDQSAEKNTLAKENTQTKIAARGGRVITPEEAREMVLDDAYAGMGVKDLRESSSGAVNVHLLENIQTSKLAKASDEFSSKKITAYRDLINPTSDSYKSVQTELTTLRTKLNTKGITSEEKTNIQQKIDNITDNLAEIRSNSNFQKIGKKDTFSDGGGI